MPSLKAKYHRYKRQKHDVIMFRRLGVDLSFRPGLKAFADKHPWLIRYLDAKDAIEEAWYNISFGPRERINRGLDKILGGPKSIQIQSLNRRHRYDHDAILLNAAFQVLVDFVEIEMVHEADEDVWKDVGLKKPSKHTGRRYPTVGAHYIELSQHFNSQHQEFYILYKWWKNIGSLRREDIAVFNVSEELASQITGDQSGHQRYALESNFMHFAELEDQQMLRRLVAIRPKMWT